MTAVRLEQLPMNRSLISGKGAEVHQGREGMATENAHVERGEMHSVNYDERISDYKCTIAQQHSIVIAPSMML